MSADGHTHRLSALPDWSAVPSNSEEDRVFFNQRIARFGLLVASLSIGFMIVNLVVVEIMAPSLPAPAGYFLGYALHGAAAGVSLLQWLACRGAKRSAAALNAIDLGGLLAALALYGVMSSLGPAGYDQAQVMVLITLTVVVTRASIVPGTARRTLWVSAAACVPAILTAHLMLTGEDIGPYAEIRPGLVQLGTAYVTMWCAMTVATATLVSRTIYGLTQRVREVTELGQYTLEEKIGEGGMGSVYRARHAFLRRPTAVKLLLPQRTGEHDLARFEREVQLTASLTHPNTIAIYDYGHTPDGVFYYAMEFLDGITFEELVAKDGPQPAGRVAHLLRQVASALSEAHGIGLIHRDIKPANLMACVRGGIADHVKVLDFGLVKDLGAGASAAQSAVTALVGTPLYMAPEAITSPDCIDARADLYALGAVAYMLLTGSPPFDGVSLLEVCGKHLHAAPEPPSRRTEIAIPASLEALVLRCLEKDPAKRPDSAAALVRALDDCGDVGAWSADQARRWWAERAQGMLDRVHAERRAGAGARSGPRTVAIDLARRAVGDGAAEAGLANTLRAG